MKKFLRRFFFALGISLVLSICLMGKFVEQFPNFTTHLMNVIRTGNIKNYSGFCFDKNGVPMMLFRRGNKGGTYVYNPVYITMHAFRYYDIWKNKEDYSYFLKYYDIPLTEGISRGEAEKRFMNATKWLLDNIVERQGPDGRIFGVWLYNFGLDADDISVPWISAMAQGIGMEALLLRWQITGEEKYFAAAQKILRSFRIAHDEGGATYKESDSSWWYAEYPRTPSELPSRYTLNGMEHVLISLFKYKELTGSKTAGFLINKGIESLKKHISEFHAPWGSYYDLVGHIANYKYQNINAELTNRLATLLSDKELSGHYRMFLSEQSPYFIRQFILQRPSFYDVGVLLILAFSMTAMIAGILYVCDFRKKYGKLFYEVCGHVFFLVFFNILLKRALSGELKVYVLSPRTPGVAMLLFTNIAAFCMLLFSLPKYLKRPSDAVRTGLVYFCLLPSMLLCPYVVSKDVATYMLAVFIIAGFILTGVAGHADDTTHMESRESLDMEGEKTVIVYKIISIALGLYILIFAPDYLFRYISFTKMYSIRHELKILSSRAPFWGYAVSWLTVFSMGLFAYALAYRRRVWLFLALVLGYASFSVQATKSSLAGFLLIAFIFFVYSMRLKVAVFSWSFGALLALAQFKLQGFVKLYFLVLRVFATPGIISSYYFDFSMQSRPIFFTGNLLKFLGCYSYERELSFVLAKKYLSRPDTNLVGNFIANAQVDLRFLGILCMLGVVCAILKLFDRIAAERGEKWKFFVLLSIAPSSYFMSNTSLPTALLTFGVGVQLFLLYMMTKYRGGSNIFKMLSGEKR